MRSKRSNINAFSLNHAQGIVRAIKALAAQQDKLHKYDFTPDELLRLFVAPEHRDLLKESYRIAAPRGFISELFVKLMPRDSFDMGVDEEVELTFQWSMRDNPDAFLVPNGSGAGQLLPVKAIQPDCPKELGELFFRTFDDLVNVSYKFGLCIWTFEQLNLVCSTPAKLRYYWPCILPLLRMAGYNEAAMQIAEPSVRAGSSVTLPPKVAAVVKQTNETLGRAHLVEQEQVNKIKLKLTYFLRSPQFHQGEFQGT